jgi:hypothetical protein
LAAPKVLPKEMWLCVARGNDSVNQNLGVLLPVSFTFIYSIFISVLFSIIFLFSVILFSVMLFAVVYYFFPLDIILPIYIIYCYFIVILSLLFYRYYFIVIILSLLFYIDYQQKTSDTWNTLVITKDAVEKLVSEKAMNLGVCANGVHLLCHPTRLQAVQSTRPV